MLGLWLCLLAPATGAAAQSKGSPPQVAAVLSSGVVKLGGTVQLVIEVDDAEDARLLSLPQADGLVITPQGRPSRSEYTRYINGRMYRRTTVKWEFEVRPERLGEFTLPPVKMNVDGTDVETPQELLLKVVRDLAGEDLGFFEMLDPPQRVYEGEPFRLDLRFGWDESYEVNAASLFLPWWDQMPGTLKLEEPAGTRNNRTMIVNRALKVGVEELGVVDRDGTSFRHFSLSRRFMATRPGTLELPSSSFEFAKLLQRGGFGRTDRYEEFYVLLPGHSIEVLPVPEQGRPYEWTGAVGQIEASRRVDRRDVDEGESIRLTVSWSGDANLEFFEAPDPGRMDSFAGFRVLGTEDAHHAGVRSVTYDLVPTTSEVTEIPSVDLWVFDTKLESYRRVTTESIPIRVRQLEGGGGLEELQEGPRRTYDIHDIRTSTESEPALVLPALGGGRLAASGLGLIALWMLGRSRVRREQDPASPLERQRRRARRRLARALRRAGGAREETLALATFLAARSGETPQSWVGRDARRWAASDGRLAEPAALALARVQDALDREVYAGSNQLVGAEAILDAADQVLRGGL